MDYNAQENRKDGSHSFYQPTEITYTPIAQNPADPSTSRLNVGKLAGLVEKLSIEAPKAQKLENSGKLGFAKSSWVSSC